jgi:hypothetical protein
MNCDTGTPENSLPHLDIYTFINLNSLPSVDLRKIGFEGVDWGHFAQERNQWLALVNTVTVKGREFLD